LPGIGALILQLFKNKPEIKKIDKDAEKLGAETEKIETADTTKTYAEALDIAGKKNIELYERIDKIEEKVEYLANACVLKDKEISRLENINKEKDARILELEKKVEDSERRIQDLEKEVKLLREKEEKKE